MEKNGCTVYDSQSHSRVSNTLFSKTTADETEPRELSISNSYFHRDDRGHSHSRRTESSRESRSESKFHFYPLFTSEERRFVENNFQPQGPERVYRHQPLQINKHVPGPKFSPTQRLVMQSGPIPSLLPLTCGKVTQVLSEDSLPRRTLRNEMSPFWPKHSAKNLCYSDKLDRSDPKRPRNKDNCLSRRFFGRKSGSGGVEQSNTHCDKNSSQAGLAYKLAEVGTCSPKVIRISRRDVVPLAKSNGAPRKEMPKGSQNINGTSQEKDHQPERARESSGVAKFRKFCCRERQTKLSRSSKTAPRSTGKPGAKTVPSVRQSHKRSPMVDTKLPETSFATYSMPNPLPNHGCVGYRVGCNSERSLHLRHLECSRTKPSLQRKRNVGHSKMLTRSLSDSEIQLDPNTNRQQNCNCIFAQRRWNKIPCLDGVGVQNFSNYRFVPNSFHHSSHTRNLQHRSRRIVETASPTRVALASRSDSESFSKMGNPLNRSVCLEQRPRSPDIRNLRQKRQECGSIQRISEPLALSSSMDLSTAVSNPKSIDTPESSNRHIHDCSSPMGTCILESRSPEPRHRSPLHNQKSRESTCRRHDSTAPTGSQEHDPGDMEMWGWSEALSSWTRTQKDLLKSSWRSSTLNTYKPAWARWTRWAQTNGVKINNPSGGDVARYLADLHNIEGLSYSTILVHKSVISTFCSSETSNISSHFLVRQVLKAIALKKPKEKRPPIWDINQVVNHLAKTKLNCNLYDTSRQTATLLLLCSGRRVHDLTLLQCDPDHLSTASPDVIIFWPAFGSKTDSSNHRQSGWRLSCNKTNKALDPIFWIDRLITLSKERRSLAKCNNLFLRVTGPAEAASRAIIGGWVKSVLKEAGVNATPGSVRAAVASNNWTENFQIDDILARGNWQSGNTFKKYYRREIARPTNSCSTGSGVPNLFTPIDR